MTSQDPVCIMYEDDCTSLPSASPTTGKGKKIIYRYSKAETFILFSAAFKKRGRQRKEVQI